jgi:hypothetical protein
MTDTPSQPSHKGRVKSAIRARWTAWMTTKETGQ